MLPPFVRKVNKQLVLSGYGIYIISKIFGEQRWLLLAKTWNWLLFLYSMRTSRLFRNWYRPFTPVYQMP